MSDPRIKVIATRSKKPKFIFKGGLEECKGEDIAR